jgi:hypothetical protein
MDWRRSGSSSKKVFCFDGDPRRMRRLKSAGAGGSRVQLNRKDRQHRVADEFEDLAAVASTASHIGPK